MPSEKPASEIAWQPLTPAGVASFARARLANLLAVQLVVALAVVAAVLWFVSTCWFPVVNSAIQRLPAGAAIRHRQLNWPGAPALLAENHFLALVVDLEHAGQFRSPAHIDVEFGAADLRAYSLFGLVQLRYPEGWMIAFSRAELEPWWGAWSPAILAVIGLAMIAGLFLCWALLAALYCPVAWLAAFFADRQLSLRGAYRLSGAALMPGALFMTGGILLYGFGVLDVVRFLAVGVAHLLLGWIYVLAAPVWCPNYPAAAAKPNPFVAAEQGEHPDSPAGPVSNIQPPSAAGPPGAGSPPPG